MEWDENAVVNNLTFRTLSQMFDNNQRRQIQDQERHENYKDKSTLLL